MTIDQRFDRHLSDIRMNCVQIALTVLGTERAYLAPMLAEQLFKYVVDGSLPSNDDMETLKWQIVTTFSAS